MEAPVAMLKMFGKKIPTVRSTLIWTNKENMKALVRGYHRDLYRYAYWLCKDKAIAEDLVQRDLLTCMEVSR